MYPRSMRERGLASSDFSRSLPLCRGIVETCGFPLAHPLSSLVYTLISVSLPPSRDFAPCMAPLRLPKVKSKGKTAPEPESHDDFMDAALVQASRREANCIRKGVSYP